LKTIHTHDPSSPAQADALNILQGLTELINQTVGDAISDMLLVEAVLAHKGGPATTGIRRTATYPTV